MESKKTFRANLESKRLIFLEIGMIIALAICLMAFEWRKYEKDIVMLQANNWEEIEEILPINTEQFKLPPPPRVVKPVYRINIVDKPDFIMDDIPVIDAGINTEWGIPDKVYLPEEVANAADDSIYNTWALSIHPYFPGGEAALYKYLNDNIRYPRLAVETNIQGTVYIGFVIEKDGSITSVRVERSPAAVLSEEASRVVSSMPDWIPGKQGGNTVRVNFILPVRFRLQ
jgi:periplasmic protein TonB